MTTTPLINPAAPVFRDEQWKRLVGFGIAPEPRRKPSVLRQKSAE
jgi:hypothetical protein